MVCVLILFYKFVLSVFRRKKNLRGGGGGGGKRRVSIRFSVAAPRVPSRSREDVLQRYYEYSVSTGKIKK